jgi:hypothetical protein
MAWHTYNRAVLEQHDQVPTLAPPFPSSGTHPCSLEAPTYPHHRGANVVGCHQRPSHRPRIYHARDHARIGAKQAHGELVGAATCPQWGNLYWRGGGGQGRQCSDRVLLKNRASRGGTCQADRGSLARRCQGRRRRRGPASPP